MRDNEQRLTDLEMSIAHLQRDLETLDKAVLDNTEKLDRVLAAIKQMNQRLDDAAEQAQQRKPEDEKPPHY